MYTSFYIFLQLFLYVIQSLFNTSTGQSPYPLRCAHPKNNPSPFMVGEGALDVPLHEVMFILYPKKKPSRFRLRKQPA